MDGASLEAAEVYVCSAIAAAPTAPDNPNHPPPTCTSLACTPMETEMFMLLRLLKDWAVI